jgi:ABC-2 type transport system permease protein
MGLKPGSLAWLLAHELALAWRRFADLFGSLTPGGTWVVCAVCVAALHLLAWPAMVWLTHPENVGGLGSSGIAMVTLSVLAWMAAQGLLLATRTLQERGHLDLLLGSPLPARTVLASRAIAIAANSFGSAAILALPAANIGAVLDGPAWLGIYPTLLALSLVGTACGLAAAIGLFLAFGPRRARLIAQFSAAIVGGAFLLAMQIAALLPQASRTAIAEHVAGWGDSPLLGLPVAAFRGEPASITWLVALAIALFAAAVVALSGAFVRAGLNAAGVPADASRVEPAHGGRMRFGASLGQTLRRKEWRLLWRDHNVFAQLSLQIVYTLPLAVVLLRGVENLPLAIALAPALVVISAQIAASLAWITVSGEDAPELIAAAPVRRTEVELAKLSAVGAPVVGILVLPFIGLAVLSPHVALLSALFAAAASVSTALLNLWHPMPGNRRGMLRRHSQSKLMAMLEHLMAMLWAIAIVLAIAGTPWVLLPVALALALLAYCSPVRLRPFRRHAEPPGASTTMRTLSRELEPR